MVKLIAIVMAIWLTLIGISAYTQYKQIKKYNNWSGKCFDDGGVVVNTRKGFVSDQFECLKDGKIINHID
jgi:hypothetical protein